MRNRIININEMLWNRVAAIQWLHHIFIGLYFLDYIYYIIYV